MPREIDPAISQRAFVLSALKDHRLRVDGRGMQEARTPELIFGDEMGWVECRFGKTRVIAQVSGTIVRPRADRPYEGLLNIHSEISPMASSVYDSGRPSEEEVVITRMLEKVLKKSDALDRESLCIVAGQQVWSIRLTLHFLSDEGNMLDCACLAGVAALKHFRRPEVEVIGEEVIIHDPSERAPMPLSMHHTPICVSLAFFEESAHPILDPTRLETQLASSILAISVTNTASPSPTLCVLQLAGGMPLSTEELTSCIGMAVARARVVGAFLERRLADDWSQRSVRVEVH
ncbi:hypothetical protein BOTBODRAFT_30200 [Botryobasidium botryosum FD-172 SS1]|uniref:Uncharacterized protein n=1 Tax=Botryobasidium botryosum (strain FD-172 SS1) TaxID=930990 RepID=A0A067MPD0_BOTB1|nr:hypothetical protein BOTBODRAFT_30200 [Botryobasidium botryosum FD-172 SS1]